jgi:hypothetical protein
MYNKILNFRKFIVLENLQLFGDKVGNLLKDLQELQENYKDIGMNSTCQTIEKIIADIQPILTGHWDSSNKKYLKGLQKVGVALSKLLEEKDDFDKVLADCVEELKNITTKLNVPINDLGTSGMESQTSQTPEKSNTEKQPIDDINPQAQPISGFDTSGAPPLGQPSEIQNPNAI